LKRPVSDWISHAGLWWADLLSPPEAKRNKIINEKAEFYHIK
jgi:hypothetical protein